MFEKVNPSHPDKVADRIAGALVDLAYSMAPDPRIAVEVLIGHGICHIIAETSVHLHREKVEAIVLRIAGNLITDYREVPQDAHLAQNQRNEIRCGDNGIFKGVPVTDEQDGIAENGPEPIEWIVLDVKDGAALLLSRYQLTFLPYHDGAVSITYGIDWENCSLRAWLNDAFLNGAFGEEDLAAVRLTAVSNEGNPNHGTPGGADTEDRVFLLSVSEITQYLPEPSDRQSLPTFRAMLDELQWQDESSDRYSYEYAVEKTEEGDRLVLTAHAEDGQTYVAYCCFDESGDRLMAQLIMDGMVADHVEATGAPYFLRSPGSAVWQISEVLDSGEIEDENQVWAVGYDGVRPAPWLDLDAYGLSRQG